MKKFLAIFFAVLFCVSALTGCGASEKEEAPAAEASAAQAPAEAPADAPAEQPAVDITVHWNEPLDPNSHPISAMFDVMKKEIEGAGVNMTFNLFPSGQLGDASSALAQVGDGVIDVAASIGLNQFASQYGITDWMVTTMPFVVGNDEEAVAIAETGLVVLNDLIEATVEELGIRFIPQTVAAPTFRIMTNNVREIRTPEDMKGLKMRTMQDETMIAMMESLGAMPTPIAFTELYTALQTGVVDGQENPAYNIALQKFYEVQDYCSVTNHNGGLPTQGIFVNQDFLDSLTPEQRAVFDAAYEKGSVAFSEATATMNENGLKEIEASGTKITYLTDEEMQAFRDVCFEPVKAVVQSKMEHPELLDNMLAEIEAIRANMK